MTSSEKIFVSFVAVSEELVILLQVRHDLQEQLAMRQIAVDQLIRLQGDGSGNSKNSTIMSLPPNGDPVTGIVVSGNDLTALRRKLTSPGTQQSQQSNSRRRSQLITVPDCLSNR